MTTGGSSGSLGACVAHLLDERDAEVPAEATALSEHLAQRGLACVSVADPAHFQMAGAFLARYEAGWVVAFGVPPGVIFDPSGPRCGESRGRILEASVLVPLELDRAWRTRPGPETGTVGRVESIAIASEAEAEMTPVPEARALAGAGLEGDRYAAGAGTFSDRSGTGRALTLVDAAAIDDLRGAGIDIDPISARRNLVVRGINLDSLIGRRFMVGEVECLGSRRCEPCAHLERLLVPGVLRGLVHRGGLRADVLGEGRIRVGDEVAALEVRAPGGAA